MSQKSTHNSKRRPPGENAEGGQQDADWGFDPDEADPVLEKKLAVALVVCLLAGFGFVFYQKFRLLRNDPVQQASAEAEAEEVADLEAPQSTSETAGGSLAQSQTDELPQPVEPDVSPAATDVENPFYQAADAGSLDADPDDHTDEGWTLAQAEVAQPSEDDAQPNALPPLPDAGTSDGFDPFADHGEETTSDLSTAGQVASPAATAPSEPPMLAWDEPAAEAVPLQSEPEATSDPDVEPEAAPDSGTAPESAPQTSPTDQAAQPDPFAFESDSSDPPSQPVTETPHDKDPPPDEEPQMLIFGEPQNPSEESADEPAETSVEPLPVQTEPQSFGALDADQTMPESPDPSGFDPFAGTAASDEPSSVPSMPASSATAESATVPSGADETSQSVADAADPLSATDSPALPAQTEPVPAQPSERPGDPQPAADPFSFPAPESAPPVENEPSTGQQPPVGTSTFDPFQAASGPEPSDQAPPPTWPEGSASRSRQSAEGSTPFPPADQNASDDPAPLKSRPPQAMTFNANDGESTSGGPTSVEPTPAFAGDSPASTSTAPPNPFSFDAGTSRPILSSRHDAQRVVGEREITVTPSDSFWSISEREYGSSRYFNALARYNKDRVAKPELLQSGMKIVIPPPEVLEDRFPELFQRTAQKSPTISPMSGTSSSAPAETGLFLDKLQRPHYRVGEKDTLSSIAQQHLGRSSRWTEIYDLNKDRLKSPSTLTIGMVLKLPPDASGVRVSPAGGFDR